MTISKRAIRWALAVAIVFPLRGTGLHGQSLLSIDKVYSVYLVNSGTITAKGEVKGYFFFYISDKIDRHTNEYTLQILDENLNKVQSIKFEDSKKLSLLESAYNGNSISFLFKNEETKTLDMRIYDFDGKLKYAYSREFNRRTDDLMKMYEAMHTDEGTNKTVYDIGSAGYAAVLPTREGMLQWSYEMDYYGSDTKKQWTYVPDDQEKFVGAEYLGCTDSLIVLEVLKKKSLSGVDYTSSVVGINFVTRKKQFEIDGSSDAYQLMASSVIPIDSGRFLLMADYYGRNANISKDPSRGLAVYEINTSGSILAKTYNTWDGDFARYLPANSIGKIEDIGYLYFHKFIRTPDNRIFVASEGYKPQMKVMALGVSQKIAITNLVIIELNATGTVVNATIYDKTKNTAVAGLGGDLSPHLLGMYLKATGAFDYAFMTGDADNSTFSVCYNDFERSAEYRGETFNAIRYNGKKFTTEKIELKSKASMMRVFPAKGGSIMIMEYFKKDKRLDFRLEKLG